LWRGAASEPSRFLTNTFIEVLKVKNSNPHTLTEKTRVLEPLANAVAAGFTEAARKHLTSTVTAACTQMEPASLGAVLKSGSAVTGMETRFDAGISGSALLLTPSPDLARIGSLMSGLECPENQPIAPEIMAACLKYFADALEASGRSLAQSHGLSIHATAPELLNPEGKADALVPLAGSYSEAGCLTLQLTMEGHPGCQIRFLANGDLLASLNAQLPGYAAAVAGESSAAPPESDPPKCGDGNGNVNGGRQQPQWNMDLILDVELEVVVSFGESQMPLRDILKLGVGSVIELEKGVNDPVTILVNEKPIARGEVVMVDGNYGVRILEVESTADRIRSLG
jgi:flagellar motor switch protein FliN